MKYKTGGLIAGVFVVVAIILGIFMIPALRNASVNAEEVFEKMGNSDNNSMRFTFSQTPNEGKITAKVDAADNVINATGNIVSKNSPKINLNVWTNRDYMFSKVSGDSDSFGDYNNKWVYSDNGNDDEDDDDEDNEFTALVSLTGTPLPYSSRAIKKFQASKTFGGYNITYDGKNQNIWDETMEAYKNVTSDQVGSLKLKPGFGVTPDRTKIEIQVDNKYHLVSVKQDVSYYTDDKKITLHYKLDNFNKYNDLTVPYNVKNDATDADDIDTDDLDY